MRTLSSQFATVLVLISSLCFIGCGGGAKTKLDTSELVTAFATGDAALKTQVDAAAKALNSGKLLDGTSSLAALAKASHETLSEPQKTALINLVSQVQTIITEDDKNMDMKVYQATANLMAALEGREAAPVGINPDLAPPPRPAGE